MSKIDELRSIALSGRPGAVDRILVSPRTAAKLCHAHDCLSLPFRKRFLANRVDIMVMLLGRHR